jgi:hypothetical protein
MHFANNAPKHLALIVVTNLAIHSQQIQFVCLQVL